MYKSQKQSGFTMAEMLIVVAIIIVLAGVGFIAVASHQRSMAQLERDTIAKEIFVAAQNHLTMAESQGYLPTAEDGKVASTFFGQSAGTEKSVKMEIDYPTYYFTSSDLNQGYLLDLMLPFGSIDETIRSGGSYLIRYQAKPAIVLDVFYCPKSTSANGQLRYGHDLGGNSYDDVTAFAGKDKNRKHCLSDDCVLGWYGGAGVEDSGDFIEAPTINVFNKERLYVTVTDPNHTASASPTSSLMLIITGEERGTGGDASRPQASIALEWGATNSRVIWVDPSADEEGHYVVVLDDITTGYVESEKDGLHFADLNNSTNVTLKTGSTFKPGENITVQAVAYSNSTLTNIAYSAERTTNSLFADPGEVATTAMIANFRHLENLDVAVSGLDLTLGFNAAEQIVDLKKPEEESEDDSEDTEGSDGDSESDPEDKDDLSWTGFVNAIKKAKVSDSVKVYALNDTTGTNEGCYRPVSPTYALTYDGKCHSIEDVKVDYGNDAGLFGTSASGSTIKNLELIDFSVKTSSGNAGALAGSLTNTTVTNVLAHNTEAFETALTQKEDDDSKARITVSTDSGSVGGLIGSATGSTVEKSAAALIVKSTAGSAGGLIGTTSDGSVTACYSGGHTDDKKNASGTVIGVEYEATNYNVTGTTSVGGLIGDAGSTEIKYSYSTCSATGNKAGGFVGTASGAITGCYATGLVNITTDSNGKPIQISGTTSGAFAGEYTGTATDCRYFEIINEITDDTTGGYTYLTPVPKTTGNPEGTCTNVTALDADASTYNTFTGAPSTWKEARPYKQSDGKDSTLSTYYAGKDEEENSITLFNLRTVAQLPPNADKSADSSLKTGDTDTTDYFADTHYGDWPVPEIFVLND